MSNLRHEDYKVLAAADIFSDGDVARVLNNNGKAGWTVCPECLVDDFLHAEGCTVDTAATGLWLELTLAKPKEPDMTTKPLNLEALTNAVAITVGMNFDANSRRLYNWANDRDMGAVELYAEIGALAALSYELANDVAACGDFVDACFPGVYAYEVDEVFGGRIVDYIKCDIASLDDPQVKRELGRLALEFFNQIGFDIPITKAIIKRLTGYEEAA